MDDLTQAIYRRLVRYAEAHRHAAEARAKEDASRALYVAAATQEVRGLGQKKEGWPP